ncbi:glycosyltransferase family 2 protein [Vibrio cholerae]|nr:glycosyltransferase family 2 protein [Vibrio cholerae]
MVIPTYNMSGYIQDLWSSIITSGLYTELSDVILVDDQKKDDTRTILESFSSPNSEEVGFRIVSYSDNKGRFMARYIGAKEASSERILFLDSRIILPDDFGKE